MLTWPGYIDGIHGTPYIEAPWIRHGFVFPCVFFGMMCLAAKVDTFSETQGPAFSSPHAFSTRYSWWPRRRHSRLLDADCWWPKSEKWVEIQCHEWEYMYTIINVIVYIYIPGSSKYSLFPPLITEAKIIASNSGKRLWFEKMPLLLLGLPFKSKRHYTSELGSKPEVVISLSRIGESPYFVCRIRQDDRPVYLYYDQNLNHNMNNLKQHLLHVVNII